uniref:WIYLD domain-containing protein n=1 Tax=Noccaea caerulescens TaxID=107243 RepID=A0A1J3DIS9_NOCCA
MAPRGRRRRPGLMRVDAARDAMRPLGFSERVIDDTIKDLLQVYGGEDAWQLIEDGGYSVLLDSCLAKQNEQTKPVADEQQEEIAQEEEMEEDHVGSSSTSLVGSGPDTGTHTFRTTDASSTITEAVMDSSPAAYQSGAARVGGARSSHCGWLSSEEETDPDEDGDSDDDEMIQLTPEPLCEELEELLMKVRGQQKRKIPTRWDN